MHFETEHTFKMLVNVNSLWPVCVILYVYYTCVYIVEHNFT